MGTSSSNKEENENSSNSNSGSNGGHAHSLTGIDMDKVTSLTDGYSCSDLTALCKEAAYGPVRAMISQLSTSNIHSMKKVST